MSVYLVGAGPGDPELITVKAARALSRADVVLIDRLANPALLEHTRADCEVIDVGKLGYAKSVPQEVTERILIEQAKLGKTVVRLKGGDPYVFGRGGEEALALKAAGIAYEVIPGISSALAGPMSAHIPVTHRGIARSVTVVTGTALEEQAPAWAHLAAAGGTLVFLMAVRNKEKVQAALLEGGLCPDTPCAFVERATQPDERTLTTTLVKLSNDAAHVRAPAILVVGDVVALRHALIAQQSSREEENHVSL